MAQDWCVAYGVLEGDEAQKAHQKSLKRKVKSTTAANGSSTGGGGGSEKKKKKEKKSKKRILDDMEFDAGMDVGGDEGIGMATL